MQEQFLWISAIPMYRASKCTRDGSSWMWLAGHMKWQLFRLVWGMRAKFGLCHCVLNCKLLSVLPDNASCLCIRLCFTVSKINLSLQIRKSSTKQKKKKKKESGGDDRGPARLSFTSWHACFPFSGFCHFAASANVGIRLEPYNGFFGWPSRWLLKVTDVWLLTLHTLQSACCFFLWGLVLCFSSN